MNYSIGDIITFKTIDETDFYLLNKDRNQIQKFSIQLHKYINETSNNEQKLEYEINQQVSQLSAKSNSSSYPDNVQQPNWENTITVNAANMGTVNPEAKPDIPGTQPACK